MKNILVTGGAGFIGSNFVRYLLKVGRSARIYNLDALTYAGSLRNLESLPDETRHIFIRGDICNFELVSSILENNQIDTIVNFAAESHVDRSIQGPFPFIQTNLIGTFTLLEAARKIWGKHVVNKRFHHISTDEVFGSLDLDDLPFKETTPYEPRSPYSASKAGSDHLVRAYFHTYGLPATITNCSNNYGPYQFPEKLVPLIILNGLRTMPLPVYGDGLQIRDWLFVEDHCEAIYLVLTNGKPGETYNIGGNNQTRNIEIVREICSILDELVPLKVPHSSLIQHVVDRQGHDRRYAIDNTKILHELGWMPKHDLQSGLRETVKWYIDNSGWVEFVLSTDSYADWMSNNYQKRERK